MPARQHSFSQPIGWVRYSRISTTSDAGRPASVVGETMGIRVSALTFRHVNAAPAPARGPSQYERLGTMHAGFDPLEQIKRELREIDVTMADLKEQSTAPGETEKYAKRMLRQLARRRADLLELKKQWLKPA